MRNDMKFMCDKVSKDVEKSRHDYFRALYQYFPRRIWQKPKTPHFHR